MSSSFTDRTISFLNRLNTLVSYGILPMNHSMDFQAWCAFHASGDLPELCPGDPRQWLPKRIEKVNEDAATANGLVERLMALPDEAFLAEVQRLASEQ